MSGNRFTHAVILDFEATCDHGKSPRPQEIIEFPSVLLDLATGAVVDEFESFVRPTHHPILSDFCRELTSITQADVDGAPVFAEVFARHAAWLAGHGLDETGAVFVTCGDWDLGMMLPAQLAVADPAVAEVPPIYGRWQNIKQTFCEVFEREKAGGMRKMLNVAGLPLTGTHHRGIDDCRNLAALLRVLIEKGAAAGPTSRAAPRESI